MTSIYGFSQLLLARDYDQATSKELIKTIHDQSARLVQLLNELLDLARIEARAGKDFKISAQPIAPIVEETLRGFANFSDKHELIVDLPGALPAVAVDADKMQQVLTNVLSNAFKYSPEGGAIRVSARVCERQQRRELGVTVQDEGIGMTPEQRARVFERFYRADSSGGIPGTGLGMSLVKEIVEIHGGSVEIDSALGKGTTVTVWLPLGEE
jgi:signal transduction histidine kinase